MAHRFDPTILREYDIRGIVGTTLFVADAHALGRIFADIVAETGGRRVAVGYDGRLTSPGLEAALVAGLSEGGIEVVRIGRGPTPMLYFAAATLDVDGGIMVTGSHNPPDHNGFKIVLDGKPFFGDAIQDLDSMALALGPATAACGPVTERAVFDDYVARIARDYGSFITGTGATGTGDSTRGLTVAWDCGNGATGEVVSRVVQKLPGRHILLNETIDGTFPAHHPDPTVPENLVQLQAAVAAEKCDLGIGFDGDGDRIGVVDAQGRILWGDQLLIVLARDVLSRNPGASIIADVKASQVLFDEIARAGGTPVMMKTGHSLIKERLAATGAPLAGEMSGHIFFAERYYGFDDAIYVAVRLLDILARAGESLTAMVDKLPKAFNTPELRVACDDSRKFAVVDDVKIRLQKRGAEIVDIDGVRVNTPDGWWLLRASNTQAVVVVRAESTSESGLERLKQHLAAELTASDLSLPDY
ncbi:MAG TPA: phosphomannomutase/phosphoglucomutase [Stellaceae bacterium]|jgi:phosphomannomutase|nr:phosphomannomutase/phosphoglucomutase [Stellaceae bacterium]